MLGVNLAALIVCVTCSTVTYTALFGDGPWLRRRKRRGWSTVACVSHEEGSKATQWPNGAHGDEDAATHEGGGDGGGGDGGGGDGGGGDGGGGDGGGGDGGGVI